MAKNYRKRFFRVLGIFIKIILAFGKEFRLTRRYGYKTAQEKMYNRHLKCAKELYSISVELGSIYIKLCQFLSTKHDIFPAPYIEILSPLQNAVPAVPFSSIEDRLTSEYKDYKQVFSYFSETPMAVASLGQVHCATLQNGKKVVVKVLKKEAEDTVDFDLAILFQVVRFVEHFGFISKHIDLSSLLDEFINVTSDELNFFREIFVAEKMRKSLSKFSYLKIPKVYKEFCTRRIIVMEYCEGVKINEVKDFHEINCNSKVLADRILEVFFEQFVFTGWVHFDPHPGNILVASGNRIVLLDFGMSGEITPDMSDAIARGIIAVMNQDSRAVLQILQEQEFLRDGANIHTLFPMVEFLLNKVAVMLNMNKQSIQTFDFTPIKKDFRNLISSEEIVVPVKWAYAGKTVAALAGFIAVLNPDFKIYEQVRKYAGKIIVGKPQVLVKYGGKDLMRFAQLMYSLPERLTHLLDEYDRGTLIIKTKPGNEANENKSGKKGLFFFMAFVFLLCGILFKFTPQYTYIGLLISGGMLLAYSFFTFLNEKGK